MCQLLQSLSLLCLLERLLCHTGHPAHPGLPGGSLLSSWRGGKEGIYFSHLDFDCSLVLVFPFAQKCKRGGGCWVSVGVSSAGDQVAASTEWHRLYPLLLDTEMLLLIQYNGVIQLCGASCSSPPPCCGSALVQLERSRSMMCLCPRGAVPSLHLQLHTQLCTTPVEGLCMQR